MHTSDHNQPTPALHLPDEAATQALGQALAPLVQGGMGVRPTLGTPRPLLEVNLFDFQGDLYGAHLSVAFLHKLRDEMKFSGLEALKAQIGRDVQAARAFFGR